jgi:hypothetical protein
VAFDASGSRTVGLTLGLSWRASTGAALRLITRYQSAQPLQPSTQLEDQPSGSRAQWSVTLAVVM